MDGLRLLAVVVVALDVEDFTMELVTAALVGAAPDDEVRLDDDDDSALAASRLRRPRDGSNAW